MEEHEHQQTDKPYLSKLVGQLWKFKSEGTQEDRFILLEEDKDALKVFQKTTRSNSETRNWLSPG